MSIPSEPVVKVPKSTLPGFSTHLTYKANRRQTRYGWLRLTPAYSVHLVAELLDTYGKEGTTVLDPFCGTGTTSLVCAERGIVCDTTDINPFLLWLTRAKTRPYSADEIATFERVARNIEKVLWSSPTKPDWIPPLHQIEKWWDEPVLNALSHAYTMIHDYENTRGHSPVADLLKIVFCRVLIENAHVSFGHQSMSFAKKGTLEPSSCVPEDDILAQGWAKAVGEVAASACSAIAREPRPLLGDARNLPAVLPTEKYGCVITSPPYPNRMSYIRELRPYMYWLGYLKTGSAAGELDWQAIGGTWGSATSYVGKWLPPLPLPIPFDGFDFLLESIAQTSVLLSRYVHKYFYDMVLHTTGLYQVMQAGGTLHYIIGNSKFYEVLLPAQEIFAALFCAAGFCDVEIKILRKRSSKKELFEYRVSARKP